MSVATEDLDSPTFDNADDASVRLGQIVGGTYLLTRHIGSGGSGHVFEADHVRLGTPFAVKLLRTDLAGRRAAQRFRREAKALARLRGDHVVRVVDCGELEDRTPYLAMELLDGLDLRRLLEREGSLPARRAVHLILDACRGLSEAHQHGLVHRDLKPENLFVARRFTGEDCCKVLDFGVAKMDTSLSTADGAIVGTVRYMAPEQLADSASVGPASDIYALGAILHECLSGKQLHAGEAMQEVMFSVMNRAPVSLGTLCPNLPRALVRTVERCVAKRVAERPQHAAELAAMLEAALEPKGSRKATEMTLPETAAGTLTEPPAVGLKGSWSLLAAMTLAALIGGTTAWALKPSEPGASASEARRAPPPAHPTVLAAQPTTASKTTTAAAVSQPEPPPSPSPSSSSSPKLPRPAPRSSDSKAPTTAATKTVSVGVFDSANPYGE